MTVKFERTFVGIPIGERQILEEGKTYVVFEQSLLKPRTTVTVEKNPTGNSEDDVAAIQTSRGNIMDIPVVLRGKKISRYGRGFSQRLNHGIFGYLLTSE